MAAAAVDCAVNPVHGSTVDRTEGVRPALIRAIRGRSHGPGLVRAGRGGERNEGRGGAAALRRREPWRGFLAAKTSAGSSYAKLESTRTQTGGGETSQATATRCRGRWWMMARQCAAATSEIMPGALDWHAKRLYRMLEQK
jgi:hypothetical protein